MATYGTMKATALWSLIMAYLFFFLLEFGATFAILRSTTQFHRSRAAFLALLFILYNVLMQEVIKTEIMPLYLSVGFKVPLTLAQVLFIFYFYKFIRSRYVH